MSLISNLDRAILKTIIYFDLFDFPLTAWEVYKNLIYDYPVSFSQIKKTLKNLKTPVSYREGFYFLQNREELIAKRKKKYLLADVKTKIAKHNLKLLRRVGGVEAIFVCNDLSYANATENSDIDLAIICAPGKIWSVRFWTTLIMKLLYRRPTSTDKKNKICLSFFLCAANLNLEPYAYQNDFHFAFWHKQFWPLYDPKDYYLKIWEANRWSSNLLKNFSPTIINERYRVKPPTWRFPCVKSLEFFWKKIQLIILPPDLKKFLDQKSKDVILTDEIIKLHTRDRRQEYNLELEQRYQKIVPRINLSDLGKLVSQAIK